jgi:hypothetical protein
VLRIIHAFQSVTQACRLRRLVGVGALGRPMLATCHPLWYRDEAYHRVPWRGRWDTEGGGPRSPYG